MENKNLNLVENVNVNEEIKNNCIATAQNKLNEFQNLEADTIEIIENSDSTLIDKRKMLVRVYKYEIEVLEAYEQFNANVSVDALASAKAFFKICSTNISTLYFFCLDCVEYLRRMEEEEANQKEILINFINKI